MEVGRRTVVSVGGINTEVYCRLPEIENSKVIVIVPGNPGLVDFYIHFVDCLYSKFQENFTVLVVSQAGHCNAGLTGDRLFSLEDQINHKKKFLRLFSKHHFSDLYQSSLTPHFILMGHSIGAYICLKVKHRYPKINVTHVVNLFPTIRNLWEGLNPVIKVIILPGIRHSIASIAHYSPTWLLQKLIALGTDSHVSQQLAQIVQEKVHYHGILNALSLAKIESVVVTNMDEELKAVVTNHGENFVWLYGHHDSYTPTHFPKQLKEEFPNTWVYMCSNEEVEHAFCISYSEEVATQTVNILSELYFNS